MLKDKAKDLIRVVEFTKENLLHSFQDKSIDFNTRLEYFKLWEKLGGKHDTSIPKNRLIEEVLSNTNFDRHLTLDSDWLLDLSDGSDASEQAIYEAFMELGCSSFSYDW